MENWREVIKLCPDADLAAALVRSLDDLFVKNMHSLQVDASERHIAAELAGHLKAQSLMAPDGEPWNIHVEYNRNGAGVKTVHQEQVVVPDIIVHRVGTANNHLAVELKKGASHVPDEFDLSKLRAYKHPDMLGYSHALFLRLGVNDDAGQVSCAVWV